MPRIRFHIELQQLVATTDVLKLIYNYTFLPTIVPPKPRSMVYPLLRPTTANPNLEPSNNMMLLLLLHRERHSDRDII